MNAMANEEQIRVVLRRSPIGGTAQQRATIRGLGLRRIGDSRVLTRTDAIVGMVRKVSHLVSVETAPGA